MMVAFAIFTLAKIYGLSFANLHPPAFMSRWLSKGHRASMNRPPVVRALLIGLLTTLLPCGWLYAFVVTAAGTAHPVSGALTMFVFWLGTLPMLIAIGAGVQKLSGTLGAKMPVITCIALLVVGIWTLAGRTLINPVALADKVQAQQSKQTTPDANQKPACCVDK
jgi:sulfite exporter TauE/SafE